MDQRSKELVQELSDRFQVNPKTFGMAPENTEGYELGMENTSRFLTNPYISSLVIRSKEEVFSREDKKTNPQKRYETALTEIMNFLVKYLGQRYEFSGLGSSSQMWSELESYIRNPESMTPESLEVRTKLPKILEELKDEFAKLGVYPSLYGSFRYGDAGKSSDIDIQFLTTNHEKLASKKRLIDKIDTLFDTKLSNNHQIRDWIESHEGIVYLDPMHSVLLDINEQATNCWEDYQFMDRNIYPFNWISEGIDLVKDLGPIESEVAEIKNKIVQATKVDPLFELQYCLRLYFSLQKRIEHLDRK